MVDVGIDAPFNKAEMKLKEHYGIDIPINGIRSNTLDHAHKIKTKQDQIIISNNLAGGKAHQIISETDGSMVPIVVPDKGTKDKRKGKQASYECATIAPKKWLHAQQQLLKCGKYETVLNNLRNYAVEHEDSATYKCYHYFWYQF